MARPFRERNAKKQTRLAFQTLPQTAIAKEGYSQAVQDRLSSVRYEGAPSRSRSQTSADSALPTPEPSSQPDINPVSSDEDDIVLPSSKRRKTGADDAPSQTPTRRSGRLAAPVRTTITSPLRDELELLGSPETSGDEDLAMVSKPTQRRRAKKSPDLNDPFIDDEPVQQRRKPADDFIVDDDEVEYISDDEPQPIRRRKKNRQRSRHEQDELDEDLEDLRTSDVEERSRTRGGIVNKQRDKAREHLELLKRRRAGEKIPRIDSEDDYDFAEEDGADLDTIGYTQRVTAHSVASSDTEQEENPAPEDDEEDDFVVEDDGEELHDIPLEYTNFATQKPKDLFFYIVEWLVMNKIAPAFPREDDAYIIAWKKVNDQIQGQTGSRLVSSAWNEDFKNAVLARPEKRLRSYSGFQGCSACNKTGHPAVYRVNFLGHAYDRDTLEPLKEDDSEDEDDSASYNGAGHTIVSSSTTFYLGSTCANNAEMSHQLTHWKYHLNKQLLTYLEGQGVLSPEMIVAREQKSKRKREEEGKRIVEDMDSTGVVEDMWRNLQGDLDDARIGMEDHQAKGRGKARIGKVRTMKRDGRIEEFGENGRKRVIYASDSDD